MIKKVSLISLVVFLVVLVSGALLAPIAVADMVEASAEQDAVYGQMKECLVIPAEGITTTSFDEGNFIEHVKVRISPDDKIHLYSNGYTNINSSFSYSINYETGHLDIGRYTENRWNEFAWLSRENLPILLAGIFSESYSTVELYLPAGISYDLDSWMVGTNEVELGLETYHGYDSEALPDEIVGGEYDAEYEWEEEPDEPQLMDAEQLRQQVVEDAEKYNDRLHEAALLYYEDGDEDAFWLVAEPMCERLAALYDAQLGRQNDEESAGYDIDFVDYFHMQLQKSLREVERARLEAQWNNKTIAKADYYERDLELDDELANLNADLVVFESTHQQLVSLEQANGLATGFVGGFELTLAEDGTPHIH